MWWRVGSLPTLVVVAWTGLVWAEPEPEPAILQAGCARKMPRSCFDLGSLYIAGRGVPRDVDRGVALIGSACEYGSGAACHALGDLRANGVFAPPDPDGAGHFYRRACLLGHQASCARVRVEYL